MGVCVFLYASTHLLCHHSELLVIIPVTTVTAGATCRKGEGEFGFKILGAEQLDKLLGPGTETGVVNWYNRKVIETSVIPKLKALNVSEDSDPDTPQAEIVELQKKVDAAQVAWEFILNKTSPISIAGEDDDKDMDETVFKFLFSLGAYNAKDGSVKLEESVDTDVALRYGIASFVTEALLTSVNALAIGYKKYGNDGIGKVSGVMCVRVSSDSVSVHLHVRACLPSVFL
jgi:hypothetical protein